MMKGLTQIRRRRQIASIPIGVAACDYLQGASLPALETFELSRLNHAANLRKQITGLVDDMVQEQAAALFARFLIQRHLKGNQP
jgi:hypothetical protein